MAAPPFAGNPRALAAVHRSLGGDRPPHAYLFAGPARVGKHTLALWLAQALNCERTTSPATTVGARHAPPLRDDTAIPSDGPTTPVGAQSLAPLRPDPGDGVSPCGECRACTRIASGIHADVLTVSFDTADDGRVLTDISVAQVREIDRAVALAPYEGRTRVVIIDPADAMNDAAQNAFLKTLEEPPPHAVFVLITTNEEPILPTISSRCRRVEFRLAAAADIEAALSSGGVEPERAALLARLAGGRTGWALEAAADPTLLERRAARLEQARAIPEMSVLERTKLAETLSEQFKLDRAQVLPLLDDWLGWWRDVLLVQAGAEDGVANADLIAEAREAAGRYARRDVLRFVRAILTAREYLEANVQSKIALEALLLEAPVAERATSRM